MGTKLLENLFLFGIDTVAVGGCGTLVFDVAAVGVAVVGSVLRDEGMDVGGKTPCIRGAGWEMSQRRGSDAEDEAGKGRVVCLGIYLTEGEEEIAQWKRKHRWTLGLNEKSAVSLLILRLRPVEDIHEGGGSCECTGSCPAGGSDDLRVIVPLVFLSLRVRLSSVTML